MFHVRETFFHDAQHVEIGSTDLFGETLAAGIVLGTVTLTLVIELLLLIQSPDDFL